MKFRANVVLENEQEIRSALAAGQKVWAHWTSKEFDQDGHLLSGTIAGTTTFSQEDVRGEKHHKILRPEYPATVEEFFEQF